IEAGDGADARPLALQPGPESLHARADGRDGSQAGDGDAEGRLRLTLAEVRIHDGTPRGTSQVRAVRRSASRATPASVRAAMKLTKWGPMTCCQASGPTSGQAGPAHACVMTTCVPSRCSLNAHFTSMPRVMPST